MMNYLAPISKYPQRSGRALEDMRAACHMARDVLLETAGAVKEGVSTLSIDLFAAELMAKKGCKSAFLGYGRPGFPGNICISLNEEVVHGIGNSKRIIQNGDIVKIDVGIVLNGWIGDNAITVPVGEVCPSTLKLLAATEESLLKAVSHACDGSMLGDLCASVEEHVSQYDFTVVREFVGHGVGRKLHEEPQIPNYGIKGAKPRLRKGMTLAIEPMINLGTPKVKVLEDKWTVITEDRKPSAHFEHTVCVDTTPEILTPRKRMFPKGTQELKPVHVLELFPS
jgi:methionyl aminopeptidase